MKKIEGDVLQTLKGEADFLIGQIRDLDRRLATHVRHLTRHEHLISAAYHLSGIYSCLEDIFSKIAKVFENRIENPASWHKELLERMRITVPGIRPAVIKEVLFPTIDEMRGFRHVFRSSYVFSLDTERVDRVAKKWKTRKGAIIRSLRAFLNKIGCKA